MTRSMGSLVALTVAACARLGPGEACETAGAGFTRIAPGGETSVGWAVPCPSGDELVPDVCSAGPCASDDDCNADALCIQIDMGESACLPASMCD